MDSPSKTGHFQLGRSTPLKEEEDISVLVALAFTIPVVLVASAAAGGQS